MTQNGRQRSYKIRNRSLEAVYSQLGKRIKALRRERGMSQEELAATADIDRSHVGFIEQGRRRPTLSTLFKICRALKISLEDLFTGL